MLKGTFCKKFKCVTCSVPIKTGKFTRAATPRAKYTQIACNRMQSYLNRTGISQVNLHAGLMQNCTRLAYKNACFKNIKIASGNTRQTQAKRIAITGKKPTQSQVQISTFAHKIPEFAGNLLSHRGQIHIKIAGKSACILQVQLPTTRVFQTCYCVFCVSCLPRRTR